LGPTMSKHAMRYADVVAAHHRIQGQPHFWRTPMLRCGSLEKKLEEQIGRRVALHFKCEHLQAGGSFKIRGALNSVLSLPGEVAHKGVVTHSSGNHGQALALAAKIAGIPATVVVPQNAPKVKVAAIEAYGASVVFCHPTLAAREEACQKIIDRAGSALVPPFDSASVMAGQGTPALEMFEDVADGLDAIVIPISGGGLIGGCAVAAHGKSNGRTMVYAAEPSGANDAYLSKNAGHPVAHALPPSATICDALRINQVGELNWPILRDLVQQVLLVDDDKIIELMFFIYERMKQVVEPSGAIATAALFTPEGLRLLRNEAHISSVGILLCGGNLDLGVALPWVK